jgi:glycosyltransferase involved in cell wall biosynthesis
VNRGAADGPALIRARFRAERMARDYARLYPRALARSHARVPEGVLIITNNFSTGGAQSSARKLLLAFHERGVRARAAVLEEQIEYPTIGRRALLAAGLEVLAVPPPLELPAPRAVARLLEIIERDPPQAILLWNVIVEHKLLLAEGLLDVPVIDVSPGEMYFASLERYFRSGRGALPFRTPRDYGARLAAVVVKYAAEAERARQVLGAPVHVIPNGVPLGPCPSARPIQGLLQLGSVARIHPHKRLDDLLAALRLAAPRLPPHVLRIAGGVDTGAESHVAELQELARGLNVQWLGELDDPGPFLASLDLFALVAEPAGCPNASLEAMARGLPIVATAVGGMFEQIDAPHSGLLVPPRDPAAFAEALVELAHSPGRRARMARAAWERARRVFSMDAMVERYGRLCGVLAAPQAGPTPELRPPHPKDADGSRAPRGDAQLRSLVFRRVRPRAGRLW